VLGSVSLSPGTCGNASFNSASSACTIDVNAKVKWNASAVLPPTAQPSTLVLKITGGAAAGYPMSYTPATNTWSVTGVPSPRGTIGTGNISIDYQQRGGKIGNSSCNGGNNCDGTFTNVQRTYWNDPDVQASPAGPIASLDVTDAATSQQLSDLHRCGSGAGSCTANLSFDVKVKGSLQLGDPADRPVALRVQGNQTQSLQCDPAEGGTNGLEDMLANGCPGSFVINTGQACPANGTALFALTPPWPCVPLRTGAPPNSTSKGLNRRILCNTAFDGAGAATNCKSNGGAISCTHPNRWPLGGPAPASYDGDPRVVDVFVTPFGTFTGNGAGTVPVIRAGRFYITGYTAQGGGVTTPCDSVGGANADVYSSPSPPPGNISGHFIVGVTPNGGGATNETCDLNEVGNCVAVLVK
jgi:hypothetical protein